MAAPVRCDQVAPALLAPANDCAHAAWDGPLARDFMHTSSRSAVAESRLGWVDEHGDGRTQVTAGQACNRAVRPWMFRALSHESLAAEPTGRARQPGYPAGV